ncbi:biopolymer transporter ExbD [Flammeovirgaceae bacterium SG7u.111]|nr:biopolymer transporter ExbD [Flammeovirgaceae bacterium SG7u.132]WPO34307.1 biopolymer transporter ExbD [Flammeovirgaceae bacterium SG7u.111]
MGFLKNRAKTEVSSGSMADIAFLLLIFFLVTTTIASDKGIYVQLPPKVEEPPVFDVKARNILDVRLNSKDLLLVEDEQIQLAELKRSVKNFIANNGEDLALSESPKKAIVSIKTDRGTSYEVYILVLDEIKKAYNELRAAHLGISIDEYLVLDKKGSEREKSMYQEAKEIFPYQVSDAGDW